MDNDFLTCMISSGGRCERSCCTCTHCTYVQPPQLPQRPLVCYCCWQQNDRLLSYVRALRRLQPSDRVCGCNPQASLQLPVWPYCLCGTTACVVLCTLLHAAARQTCCGGTCPRACKAASCGGVTCMAALTTSSASPRKDGREVAALMSIWLVSSIPPRPGQTSVKRCQTHWHRQRGLTALKEHCASAVIQEL